MDNECSISGNRFLVGNGIECGKKNKVRHIQGIIAVTLLAKSAERHSRKAGT